MPTSKDHYAKAERYLAEAEELRPELGSVDLDGPDFHWIESEVDRSLRFALVHATLATVTR